MRSIVKFIEAELPSECFRVCIDPAKSSMKELESNDDNSTIQNNLERQAASDKVKSLSRDHGLHQFYDGLS